jgi:LAO/AO transport system kinase
MVAQLVDCFLALMLPNAGDELQGIKKGIIEIADIIAINKADGQLLNIAKRAKREHENALHYLRPRLEGWQVPVVLLSALEKTGLQELWQTVESHRDFMVKSGFFSLRRSEQRSQWMWHHVQSQLLERFHANPSVQMQIEWTEASVRSGNISPIAAAQLLLNTMTKE